MVADSIEHYKIYLIIHEYTLSKDKETAKEKLKNCDLSGLKNFNPEIKSIINNILSDSKVNINIQRKRKNNLTLKNEYISE